MTAPVDVLAVMDDLVERYIANRGTTSQFIKCVTPGVHGDDDALRVSKVGAAWLDLIEARAAVAELIDAIRAFRSDQSTAALQRLSAAIARVQGGAA